MALITGNYNHAGWPLTERCSDSSSMKIRQFLQTVLWEELEVSEFFEVFTAVKIQVVDHDLRP
jgi:hypothetical protein